MGKVNKEAEKSAINEINDGIDRLVSDIKTGNRDNDEENGLLLDGLLELLKKINEVFEEGVEGSNVVYLGKDKRRNIGSGIKSFGFTEAAYTSALTNPNFVPSYLTMSKFKADYEMCITLRQLYDTVKQLEKSIADTMSYYYDVVYHDALEYYSNVKTAAANRVPGASVEYEMLKKYFKRSRTGKDDGLTVDELEKDVHALMTGKKGGKIVIENTLPTVKAGERKVVDETYREHIAAKDTLDVDEKI